MQIASLYDADKNGILDENERQEAIKALKGGLETKQRFRDESPLVEAIHLGKSKMEESADLKDAVNGKLPQKTPLKEILDSRNNHELSESAKNVRRYATRSDMLKNRRQEFREYEDEQYNDFERDNLEALRRFTIENQLAGPKIFGNINSDIIVQDKTWTDRTVGERGPHEVKILRNVKSLNKLQARKDNGLTKYPDPDLDYEDF